jgi:serine/threonine protein kinase/WD40 repeat protein/Flp pilus assembly protein TadD
MLPETTDQRLLNLLADRCAAELRAGREPDLDALIREHPDHEQLIRELASAVRILEAAAPADTEHWDVKPSDSALPDCIGDYRIVRLIGRGGMGIVYEAEQVSLGRRVALKVLPSAGSAETVERFRREARAAARLHHTNIVPVFETGQHDATFFYAMQFIAGQGLDQVIQALRRLRNDGAKNPLARLVAERVLATSRIDVQPGGQRTSPTSDIPSNLNETTSLAIQDTSIEARRPDGDGSTVAALAHERTIVQSRSQRNGNYYRNVAEIGRQVADALAYSHRRGILHRDIKPSNLLLDTGGVVWVADFGLAKTEDDQLTGTGTLLGTLLYMSPERFRGQCDRRADVYATGLTLYELLTLQPAFNFTDRMQLIDRICSSDPPRPRSIDPRIPKDLETIVLKAIEREPHKRYQTADELADDLRRFLDDEPVRARRIGPMGRLVRWTRRNRSLAALTGLIVLFVFAALIGSIWAAAHFQKLAEEQSQLAHEKEQQRQQADQARREAQAAKLVADRLAIERRESLVSIQLDRASDYLRDGETLLALPWLAAAAELEADDPRRAALHRLRLDTTLRSSPQLFSARHAVGDPSTLCQSSDGRYLTIRGSYQYYFEDRSTARSETLSDLGCYRGAMAMAPGRPYVALPLDGRGIQIRDMRTSQELVHIRRNSSEFRHVDWHPTRDWILVTDGRGITEVHDVWKPDEVAPKVALSRGWSRWSGFVLHGARAAIVSSLGEVKVRDLMAESSEWTTFETGANAGVAVSAARGLLATIPGGHNVDVWDLTTGQKRWTLEHPWRIKALQIAPQGRRLAAVGYAGRLTVWDLETGQDLIPSLTLEPIGRVAFSPNERYIAVSLQTNEVRIWDLWNRRWAAPTIPHSGPVELLEFSTDGEELLAVIKTGTLHRWRWQPDNTSALNQPTSEVVQAIKYSPQGELVTVAEANAVSLMDGRSLQPIGSPSEVTAPVRAMTWSTDGSRLAAVVEPNGVCSWKIQDSRALSTLKWLDTKSLDLPAGAKLGGWSGRTIALSPDGRWLAVPYRYHDPADGFSKGGFVLADLESSEPEPWHVNQGRSAVYDAAFTPDGKHLIFAAYNGGLWTVDVSATEFAVQSRSFRSKGDVGVSWPQRLTTWKSKPLVSVVVGYETGHACRVETVTADGEDTGWPSLFHSNDIWGMALDPSEQTLATVTRDRRLFFWDIQTGELRFPPLRLSSNPEDLVWSHDGRFVIIRTESDGIHAMCFVDASRGKLAGPPREFAGPLVAACDPQALRIVTATRGKSGLTLTDLSQGLPQLETLLHESAALCGRRIEGADSFPLSPGEALEAWRRDGWHALDAKDWPKLDLQPMDQRARLDMHLTRRPRDASAWLARGQLRTQQGDLAGAEADLRMAYSLDSQTFPVLLPSGWSTCGPFPIGLGDGPLPPEAQRDVARPVALPDELADLPASCRQWQPFADADPHALNLLGRYEPREQIIVYAQQKIYSPIDQDVLILLRHDDGLRLWLGDEVVHEHNQYAPEYYPVEVSLRSGWNTLLVRITNTILGSGFWWKLPESPLEIADGYIVHGTFEKAEQILTEFTARLADETPLWNDQRAQVALLQAKLFAARGEIDAAWAEATRATDLAPLHPDAWLWMLNFRASRQEWDQIVPLADQVLRVLADHRPVSLLRPVLNRQAELAAFQQQWLSAANSYEAVGSFMPLPLWNAGVAVNYRLAAGDTENLSSSLKVIEKVLRGNPGGLWQKLNPEFQDLVTTAVLLQQRDESQWSWFSELPEARRRESEYLRQGLLSYRRGEYQQAEHKLKLIPREDSLASHALFLRSLAFQSLENSDRAKDLFRQGCDLQDRQMTVGSLRTLPYLAAASLALRREAAVALAQDDLMLPTPP